MGIGAGAITFALLALGTDGAARWVGIALATFLALVAIFVEGGR